jgi:putative resolvase
LYRTALNWFHAGTLPVPARQLPTGTILVEPSAEPSGKTVVYCRVSSADQRDDVERQAGRVAEEAGERGITLDATVTEVGSGLDGDRAKLRKVLADPGGERDRGRAPRPACRFGVEHREAALAATGRRIIVLNQDEVKDDLVRDMIEVVDVDVCSPVWSPVGSSPR